MLTQRMQSWRKAVSFVMPIIILTHAHTCMHARTHSRVNVNNYVCQAKSAPIHWINSFTRQRGTALGSHFHKYRGWMFGHACKYWCGVPTLADVLHPLRSWEKAHIKSIVWPMASKGGKKENFFCIHLKQIVKGTVAMKSKTQMGHKGKISNGKTSDSFAKHYNEPKTY